MEECLQGEHNIHIVYKIYKETDESMDAIQDTDHNVNCTILCVNS